MNRISLILVFSIILVTSAQASEVDKLTGYLKQAKSGRISGELQKQLISDLEEMILREHGRNLFTSKPRKVVRDNRLFKNRKQESTIDTGEVIGDEAVIGPSGGAVYGEAK